MAQLQQAGFSSTYQLLQTQGLSLQGTSHALCARDQQGSIPRRRGRPCICLWSATRWPAPIDSITCTVQHGLPHPYVQIKAAHEALSAAHPLHSSKLKSVDNAEALREQCRAFDPLITFDAKHALQNASIVGECVMQTAWLAGLMALAVPWHECVY